ncbi:ATP-binding protein [Acetivibrio straminisolvens]|uniref:histidine kinase n=1 Tax=Acetivibrio straminisolvens JCM 21531 TaxID=1294263 RepID=W4V6V9_9FIRM|nr:ATP-binding protein [Acetivibrio straminisolvens]GAE88932.1 two-component sensor kinase SA14-24 [Acetivibrio straminisolvens JCM 21531]
MVLKRLQFLRSLQWRLVTIFILLALVLAVSASVSLNYFVELFFYDTFKAGIENGFEYWGIDEKDEPTKDQIVSYLTANNKANAMSLFFINNFRTFTIIDKNTNEIIYTDVKMPYRETLREDIIQSRNYLAALAGDKGDKGKLIRIGDKAFFDYARRIGNTDYILYFRYDREEWAGAIEAFNDIIKLSFLIAVILSLIFGYALSKTITVPIVNLMHKAREMAAGDFGQVMEVKSDDEIGKLTKAFNFMSKELKNTLNQISREKSKIETILNYMTDGIIAFNINGEVIHINPVAKAILEIDKFDFDFNEFSKRYNLDVSIEEVKYLEIYNAKEASINIGEKYVKIYFALFTDEENNADGIIAVLHDITEQQKLENMRKEFVANVSHELRTPLTSIKSYAETLLDGALEEKEIAEKFLGVINSEADRMTRLVKDLLQLSRLDNNQMKWDMQKISFEALVKNCIEKVKFESTEKNQILECFTIGEIMEIFADRDRIEQVVLNILTNAIKYTPEGGKITVYIGKMYSDVYVKVIDSGIGIPKEDIERIFERFYRTDKARSREMGGTGLGLAIAKEIVEAHKGTISVASELGKGTEVTVKLPACN